MNHDEAPSSQEAPERHAPESALGFRVVGIGASAGGVEAFSRLLRAVPADTGHAFVLLSHLSPTHHSELARLLSPLTWMPVHEATNGERVRPNHVYVLPPDRVMSLESGRLVLSPREVDGVPTAIDRFFESLAVELGPLAVGVILTGTGSDGTTGLRAIKAHGGETFAHDPALAAYSGMPQSAIDAGVIDVVLPLEGISRAVGRLGDGADPKRINEEVEREASDTDGAGAGADNRDGDDPDTPDPALSEGDAEALEPIIKLLQSATGVDFHHYKRPTLARRIRSRASELNLTSLADYLARLRKDPSEVGTLFQAVLIQVTRFFRETEMFEALRHNIIPALARDRKGETLRAWVIGCATGEEVYSLGIAFLEVERELGAQLAVRIFASDISDPALATARLARYPASIAAQVSAERLEQFFTPSEQGYEVNRRLREMSVFARHDITHDPPFAQLDLVLCCNVLIYLGPVLQRRLLQNIHYALKPGGYLVLGPAETTSGVEGLFSAVDRKNRIYVRRAGPSRIQVPPAGVRGRHLPASPDAQGPRAPRLQWSTAEVQRAAERALFESYPSASVIVNQDFEVLHFQGQTSPWLASPTGGPTVQLLRLAHPDLQLVIGRMLRRARKDNELVRRDAVEFGKGKKSRRVDIAVVPVGLDDGDERYLLVVFEDQPGRKAEAPPGARSGTTTSGTDRLHELEAELAENKEYLQSFIDQQDAAHAELQAAYEASLSVNEEYQSTNEELESAKEELQSLNEELTTVNEQLQHRNAELQLRSAEISGLMEALDMPLLLISRHLELRAYNARAAADFHLTPGMLGRELGDRSLPVSRANLLGIVESGFAAGEPQELEIKDPTGRWQALRLWPIHTAEEGTAALALVDIAKLKADVAAERAATDYREAILDAVTSPIAVLDEESEVLYGNRAYRDAFDAGKDSAIAQIRSDWGESADRIFEFIRLARNATDSTSGPDIRYAGPGKLPRIFRLSGGPVNWDGPRRLLLKFLDVTGQRRAEAAAQSTARLQVVGQLAGGVAHEINNQMTVIVGLVDFLRRDAPAAGNLRQDIDEIGRSAARVASVSQQLLAFSRRQTLQPVAFELNTLVASADTILRRLAGPDVDLRISLGARTGQIRADQAQIEQMLINLVVNARDAVGQGGWIRIETSEVIVTEQPSASSSSPAMPEGVYARLVVSDNGSGMDEAVKAKIFEPFFTTKPVGQGTGLGLASVYGLVRQSGGAIWVESEAGKGSRFTIDLPQVATAGTPVKPSSPAPLQETAKGSGTVLVVDDEEPVRRVIARSLSDVGYDVLEAADGNEALRIVTDPASGVELVLTDVKMPGMSGGELHGRLASESPETPVLFMSGFGADELVESGHLEPGLAVLQKPFTSAELAARVAEAMARSK